MSASWAHDFCHRNDDNFNFLQHNIKGNLDSILMNTSKPNPEKVYDTKLVSEAKMKELEELERRNMSNYNKHMNMRNVIMADNESTINLCCNRSYLRNGQTWKEHFNTTIEKNGEMLVVDEMGCVEGFGEAWFYEKAITNVLSYADLCYRYHAHYDNWIQDAFYVETDNGTKFFRQCNKLCFHAPGNKALCMSMNKLEQNKRSFNNRQVKEVERVRELT